MTQQQYSVTEFAARIKEKYPSYADMDDQELVDKIVAKYPQYGEQIKKKDDTESVSEVGSLEPPVVEEQAERARNLRPTARLNEDGTESTVLMASMEVDGKNVAIPTLFPKDPNNVTSSPEDWMELDAMEAYNTALERGEVFEFETPEEANAFAEGSWKVDTPVEQPRTEVDTFFDMALEGITPELIDRGDENRVASELNQLVNQFGFDVESSGFLTDALTVTAKNGQSVSIDLDPWRGSTEVKEADKLRQFLVDNRRESENILKQQDDYQDAKLKFANEKQIGENIARLSQEENDFLEFSQSVNDAALQIQKKHAGLEKYTEEYLRANPEEYDEYKAQYEAYAADMAGLEDLDKQLQRRYQELRYADQEIKRATGEFFDTKSQSMGAYDIGGFVKRAFAEGSARIGRGMVDFMVDVGQPGRRIDMMSERDTEDYKEQFLATARDMGVVGIPEEGGMEWVDGVGDALRNDVEQKMLDDYAKAIKFGGKELEKMVGFSESAKEFIGEEGLGQEVFNGIKWAFGETEPDYAYDLAKEGWWGGALLGAIESIPAFIGLGKSAVGQALGAGTRLARLYTQTSDHVDEEFRRDPELREVSEKDKLKLKAPLALTVAALEQVGLRNVLESKGVASSILLKAIGKSTERAAGRTFREVIQREVNNAVGRGLITLGAGGAAEFETGAVQELADITAKTVWNAVKEDAELGTPESVGEGVKQILNAGLQEAVGAGLLGGPTAIGAMAGKSDFSRLSNAELAAFEWMSNPGNRGATKPMLAAHLKNLVNQGKLTGAEAKAALDGYERTSQAMDGIRNVDGLSPKQKKAYLALEIRRRELEQQLDGRAAPFKKAIEAEIGDIKIRQKEIADAVQESSTEKVPTRDETEAGPEVGGKVQDDEKAPEKKGLVDRMRDRLKQRRVRKSKAEYDKALTRVAGLEEQGATEEELSLAKSDADRARIDYLRNTLTEEQAAQESELDNERERLWEEYQKALGTEQEGAAENAWFESTKKLDAFFDGVESGITQEAAPVEETAPEVEAVPEEEVTPTEEAAPELAEEERAEAEALAAEFEAEGTPERTETTEAGVDVQRKEGTELTKKQQRVVEQANKVITALKSVIPDIKVVAHQTQLQYEAATGKVGRGVYLDNTIHINLAKANSRTAFHEAFHAIFLQQVKDGDPDAQRKAKVLLNTIRKAVPAKSVLANRIEKFLAQYQEQYISEEALAEIFGYVADGYGGLGVQAKSKIKAAVKKIIETVIRRKLGDSWSDGDQAVLDALELLAGKVERGETITEEDVSGIEVSEEAAKKAEAETDIDRAIGRIQKMREGVVRESRTLLGDLALLVENTGKGRPGLSRLAKAIGDSKLRSIEKKIRDVKKSKKMSEQDKAERVASLEKDAAAEIKRIEAAREQAAKDAAEIVEKLKPIQEQNKKDERLAEIREEQREITKKLDKDKREAKRVYEGEERKEYVAGLKEEADAKRAALRDEIAELRGEKKKVEEVVEEAAPVEEETPTVGTIRTKVGVEAFGKLEAAVRSYLEYMDTVANEEERTRGEKATISRRGNKVNKLADELGLTGTELAVVQNSVREARREEERAEANRKAEEAERKAAAERAKKANTKANLELMLTSARTALEEAEAELARQEEEGAVLDSQIELVEAAQAEVARLEAEAVEGVEEKAPAKPAPKKKAPAKPVKKRAPAKPVKKKAPAKKPAPKEIVEEMFGPETEQERAAADARNKQLMLEMQAEVEGISVEEFTKEQQRVELQRKDALSRQAKRELDGLKGKTDKESKAKRAELKEFMSNLGTMSVDEAQAKRRKTPTAREQKAVYHVTFEENAEGIRNNGLMKDRPGTFERKTGGQFDTAGKTFAFENLTDALAWAQMSKDMFPDNPLALVVVRKGDKVFDKDPSVFLGSGVFTQDEVTKDDILSVEPLAPYFRAKGTPMEGMFTPKAREQRVADVVERYEFRPNGSLKNASLADELRRNLKRYGFGVKQFGTRMDEFHIVDLATGRKVDPKKLIAKDRADEKVEMKQRAEVRERDAKERMEREDVEDRRTESLKQYQDEYLDFPEDMIPPSTLSAREQREDLSDSTVGFSVESVVQFAKERGYSDKAILLLRPDAQAAIDEYDAKAKRVSEEIQGIIQRTKERARRDPAIQAIDNKGARAKAVNDRVEADVIAYLRGTKLYEDASDVGRNAMELAVKKQMGRRIKAAPSVNAILDAPKGKSFTVNEKEALRQKIRDMARSSRTTAAAIAAARKALAKDIAKLRKGGALTPAQATALMSRMARTNPLNEASVNKFVEYADNVFKDADYAAKMNRLNRMRKRARTNAEKKTGVNLDVIDAIRTITGINAELIPDDVLEEYSEVIEQLAERKAVLDLENRASLREKLGTILDAIDQELNAKDELLAEFENFEGKVYTKEGKVNIAKTIKAMVEAGVITEDEAKLLRKYSQELFPEPEGKTEEELENARDEEKKRLMTAVEAMPNLDHKFPSREENALLRQFNQLIKTTGIEVLDNAELKNLLRVASNIENGFLPHMAEVLVEKIDAENKRAEVMASVYNDSSGLARLIDKTGLTSLRRRGRKNPVRYVDQVWGDFKSTRLFDAVFKDLAVAAARYRSELQIIEARMSKVEDGLIKALNRNPNKITRAKFLLGAYMMQKEADANPGAPGIFSAVELLDATIEQANEVGNKVKYSEASAEVLQSVRDEIEGRTAKEIEAIIRKEQGGEAMMAVAEEIRKINDELTPKAQYTASVIRGVPFMPYSQYFHRVVLQPENEPGTMFTKGSLADMMNKRMMPSTKAKNLEERVTDAPPPVNFDPFASVNRGAKFVLTDYHMTKPVRTNKRMVNQLRKEKGLTGRQKDMIKLLAEASDTLTRDMLIEAVNQDDNFTRVFNYLKKTGYRAALGQIERAIAELGSNLSYAMFVDHGSFLEGQKYRNIYGGSGAAILRNTGSMQTTRLFPGGQGTDIDSTGLDQIRAATTPGRAEIRNEASNKAAQIMSQTGGRLEKAAGGIADFLITKPDQMISRPLWFGSFAREFESRTGKKPDMNKIAENDAQYMEQYRDAVAAATEKADDTSIKAGATDNLFLGVLNGTIRPDASPFKNAYTFINSYMTRFLIFEYVTARTAVNALVGNGMIRKGEGARLLAGVSARMFTYQLIAGALRDFVGSLLYGDDDEEKDLSERAFMATKQGLLTLILGRTMGQVGRGAVAIPMELINRDLTEARGEEYDYDKRVMMPLIDVNQDKQFKNKLADGFLRTLGPLSPAARAAVQAGEVVSQEVGLQKRRVDRERAEQEQLRALIKVLGAAGILPFYNDVIYHYQRYIYKDLDKKDTGRRTRRTREPSARRRRESRSPR